MSDARETAILQFHGHQLYHKVQRRMISVDNFFVFLRLLFFAVLLLYTCDDSAR